MKKLIRQNEFEKIYDLIMARENIEIVGEPGSGKSYLLQALKEKLEGRRVCLHLNFENVFTLSLILEKLALELKQLSVKHHNLAFQVKRFREENPGLFDKGLRSFSRLSPQTTRSPFYGWLGLRVYYRKFGVLGFEGASKYVLA